jgi:hypothetical protein
MLVITVNTVFSDMMPCSLTFRRNILRISSESWSKPSKECCLLLHLLFDYQNEVSVFFYKTARRHTSSDFKLAVSHDTWLGTGWRMLCMEPETSFPCSREPATLPYPEAVESNNFILYFSNTHFNIILPSELQIFYPVVLHCINITITKV